RRHTPHHAARSLGRALAAVPAHEAVSDAVTIRCRAGSRSDVGRGLLTPPSEQSIVHAAGSGDPALHRALQRQRALAVHHSLIRTASAFAPFANTTAFAAFSIA